jgi:hypothetical protein
MPRGIPNQAAEEVATEEQYEGSFQELSDTAFPIYCSLVRSDTSERSTRQAARRAYELAGIWLRETAEVVAENEAEAAARALDRN